MTDYAPDTAPAVKNWGDYWLLGVAMPYHFGPDSSLTVGWAYTAGSNNYVKQGPAGREANPDAMGRGVFTLSYARTF
jgi:long-subunit fatty acid transport protein